MSLTLYSPAKINLFLRILDRRPDGYHELASLFQAITLSDVITFSLAKKDHLTCTDLNVPVDSSNLVIKAANLFRARTGITQGINIHIVKNIPIEAGLGGGSSNAATTLWALNELCGRPASTRDLMNWGADIGSDVPFFLSQGTAYCTGRGECVQLIPSLPPLDLWIVKPSNGLSTASVYRAFKQSETEQRNPEQHLTGFLEGIPSFFNDLEAPAFSLLPQLQEFKEKLIIAGFSSVLMSGSGSSFFCIGNADIAFLKEEGVFCFKAKFLNRSHDNWYSLMIENGSIAL